MEPVNYECEVCTYWEAIHGINGHDYHDEKYKRCLNCNKRVEIYRTWVEERGK